MNKDGLRPDVIAGEIVSQLTRVSQTAYAHSVQIQGQWMVEGEGHVAVAATREVAVLRWVALRSDLNVVIKDV